MDKVSVAMLPLDTPLPDAKTETDLALKAEAAGDHAGAVPHWRAASQGRPNDLQPVIRLIGALDRSGQTGEAEAVARDGLRLFPDQSILAIEYGWLAARHNRWPEAVSRWQDALRQFPDEPRLHAPLGVGLTELKRFAEAEVLFAAAVTRFDSNPNIAINYATLAARQGHWPDAVLRWRHAARLSPDNAHVAAQLGQALRHAGETAEARAVLTKAAERLPPHLSVVIERAILEEPEWEAAIPRWQAVVDQFPDKAQGYIGLANAFVRNGDAERAEPILAEAAKRFPNDKRVAHDFAHLATDRRDWDAALIRWERLRALEPTSTTAYHRIGEARWGATLDTLLEAPPVIERFQRGEGAASGELSEADLIMQFESLGENCEFGLVQRYYNAEPLGLLRFAATSQEKLLEALKARFEGVGEPEYTTLVANPGEYVTGDRRYGMASHTFINPRSVDAESLFPKQCKRLGFLRNKLLNDLATPEKTFLVLAHSQPTEEAGREIHAALKAYGPARLLFVRAHIEGHEPGSVDLAEDGLMFGYLDRYGHTGKGWDISNAVWLTLCRRAYQIAQSLPA